MMIINILAKRCLNFLLKFINNEQKLAAMSLISSTLTLNDELHEAKYGWLPPALLNYETSYNWKLGGWYNPNKEYNVDYGSVELEVGRFFYSFVLLTQPKTILETGVLRGYSTCLMASALKLLRNNGHIYCIDPMKITHLWENTEIEGFITWLPKISQESFDTVKDMKFDLLVLDSDHSYNTAMWELINFEKLLNTGGHIIMHDSLFFDGVGAAVKQLYVNPRFEVITLDTPRKSHIPNSRYPGITIARKKSEDGPELKYESEYDGWLVGDRTATPFLRRP